MSSGKRNQKNRFQDTYQIYYACLYSIHGNCMRRTDLKTSNDSGLSVRIALQEPQKGHIPPFIRSLLEHETIHN